MQLLDGYFFCLVLVRICLLSIGRPFPCQRFGLAVDSVAWFLLVPVLNVFSAVPALV